MNELKEAIKKSTRYNNGEPLLSLNLNYDSPQSQLEPIYFWLLDFLSDISDEVEKITDNFTAAPGSGHFAEMGARATRMQEEGMKILGAINQVVKSILNLIYDLKEFEIRLGHYEDARSEDKEKREAGMLALKQIWLDNVDIKRGNGSINRMTYEFGFTTLRDAFMIANSVEEVKNNKIINDQVKRILIPRISEFLKWKDYSEKELRKRFEIERSYLRSQVETLKLYTSWVRPYLKAAEQLRQKGFEKNPALVNAFNTVMFELVLLGKKKFNLAGAVASGDLPPGFSNYKLKRQYYSCYVVSLIFRVMPQKITPQHYSFGGKVEMDFDAYVLNDEELKLVKKELEKEDIEESLSFAQEATDKSLEQLKEDIEHFLNYEEKKEEKEKPKETNPFSALFSLFKPKKKEEKEISDLKDIKKDNFVEKEIRRVAGNIAQKGIYAIYDVYKKAHGMPTPPEDFYLNLK